MIPKSQININAQSNHFRSNTGIQSNGYPSSSHSKSRKMSASINGKLKNGNKKESLGTSSIHGSQNDINLRLNSGNATRSKIINSSGKQIIKSGTGNRQK